MYIKKVAKISAFSLIEVMIAALILSISLLGAASLQSKSLFTITEAGRQETATQMINQLITFALSTDQNSASNPVNLKFMVDPSISPTNSAISSCYNSAGCSPQDFYIATVSEWQNLLSTLLPNGQGCTCLVPTVTPSNSPQAVTLRVAINWKNISGSINTVTTNTQIPSAIIPIGYTPLTCLTATMPQPLTITSTATRVCNSNV